MPNRIIREAFLTSEKVNSIYGQAECFFVRLMLVADDFGRFYAHPNILRAKCFPLRDDVKSKDIETWLKECAQAGVIKVYAVENRQYLEIQQFNQRTRAAVSKFPPCDSQATVVCQSNDGQMTVNGQTSAHVFGDVFGDVDVYATAKKNSDLDECEKIYAEYPKKVGKGAAIKSISKALKEKSFDELLAIVKKYHSATTGQDLQFIPHPATWFNQQRYLDDPATWVRNQQQQLLPQSGFLTQQKLKLLQEKIDKHPANRESRYHDPNCTDEQKAELKHLKCDRDELLCQ